MSCSSFRLNDSNFSQDIKRQRHPLLRPLYLAGPGHLLALRNWPVQRSAKSKYLSNRMDFVGYILSLTYLLAKRSQQAGQEKSSTSGCISEQQWAHEISSGLMGTMDYPPLRQHPQCPMLVQKSKPRLLSTDCHCPA